MRIEDLEPMRTRLLRGLRNEAQVKQSIILPVLRALGWDIEDPGQLSAEFQAGAGRVDYALLDHDEPCVFIEAKQVGGAGDDKAHEQLFGYASEQGVPILVLADGERWDFYFGLGRGTWRERCFRHLALTHDDASQIVEFLNRHLGRLAIASGEARRSADELLRESQAFNRAQKTIPSAWRSMLRDCPDLLSDLLAKQVEAECGTRPRPTDIRAFIARIATDAPTVGSASLRRPPETSNMSTPEREIPSPSPTGGTVSRVPRPKDVKRHQGLSTPNAEFTAPILQALDELGGKATRKDVLARVGEIMAPRLNEFDLGKHKSGAVRWEKNAEFQREAMANKLGLLRADSARGVWELTEKGRTAQRAKQPTGS